MVFFPFRDPRIPNNFLAFVSLVATIVSGSLYVSVDNFRAASEGHLSTNLDYIKNVMVIQGILLAAVFVILGLEPIRKLTV